MLQFFHSTTVISALNLPDSNSRIAGIMEQTNYHYEYKWLMKQWHCNRSPEKLNRQSYARERKFLQELSHLNLPRCW